jgi:hypothetical protein
LLRFSCRESLSAGRNTTQRVRLTLMSLAIPVLCMAAASPQAAVDDLLDADRAFSTTSARTDVVAGLSPMFAADVVMPSPPLKYLSYWVKQAERWRVAASGHDGSVALCGRVDGGG